MDVIGLRRVVDLATPLITNASRVRYARISFYDFTITKKFRVLPKEKEKVKIAMKLSGKILSCIIFRCENLESFILTILGLLFISFYFSRSNSYALFYRYTITKHESFKLNSKFIKLFSDTADRIYKIQPCEDAYAITLLT